MKPLILALKVWQLVSIAAITISIYGHLIAFDFTPGQVIGFGTITLLGILYWFRELIEEARQFLRYVRGQTHTLNVARPYVLLVAYFITIDTAQFLLIAHGNLTVPVAFSMQVFGLTQPAYFYHAMSIACAALMYLSNGHRLYVLTSLIIGGIYPLMAFLLLVITEFSNAGILTLTYLLYLFISIVLVYLNELKSIRIRERLTEGEADLLESTKLQMDARQRLQSQQQMIVDLKATLADADSLIQHLERLLDEHEISYEIPVQRANG